MTAYLEAKKKETYVAMMYICGVDHYGSVDCHGGI